MSKTSTVLGVTAFVQHWYYVDSVCIIFLWYGDDVRFAFSLLAAVPLRCCRGYCRMWECCIAEYVIGINRL